jgi:ribonuclease Z
MRPTLHPRLVNGRFGDPALYVEILHRREALLLDAGDLSRLSARELLRIEHVLISHMHMDHFIGIDALVRVNIGRQKTLRALGPPGILECFAHKLKGYDWDLVDRYSADLVVEVVSIGLEGPEEGARFSFKRKFEREPFDLREKAVLSAAGLNIETALLEHHGPCLGFAISEPVHVNVWKSRLDARGLQPGGWLQLLKSSILADAPDDELIELVDGKARPLRELRDLVTVSRGQKIAYVTDVADTSSNRTAIERLAQGADLFFLEARFSTADAELARGRAHLTTRAAGEIARLANARRLEPFHFSPRYEESERNMLSEVAAAFGELAH